MHTYECRNRIKAHFNRRGQTVTKIETIAEVEDITNELFPLEMFVQEITNLYLKRALQLTAIAFFFITIGIVAVLLNIGPDVAPDVKLIDAIASVGFIVGIFAATIYTIIAVLAPLINGR